MLAAASRAYLMAESVLNCRYCEEMSTKRLHFSSSRILASLDFMESRVLVLSREYNVELTMVWLRRESDFSGSIAPPDLWSVLPAQDAATISPIINIMSEKRNGMSVQRNVMKERRFIACKENIKFFFLQK